ncbi:thioredoxin TrxC [Undibacterium cyanobacteriorum]|uniref:Thioredoxin n=1 Tax=Undibacterium cyanobacteriorum TaxID=3073561 RepID=A0ABY9RF37_9BURK|nr:thioredoxin TrxC [Undibacterium sp. 20NA77.5]WMW79832.1 thioredoxin TrxC [Undibacterium sp. 20NA77.5]
MKHIVCASCGATNRVEQARLLEAPVCGKCGEEIMAAKPMPISEAAFAKFVAKTEVPVLVDFWAAWCGPCRMMAPQFEQAAKLLPELRLIKVDSDAAPQLSQQLAIRSIPSLVLFKDGREIARQAGVMPAAELATWVRSQLGR